MYLILRISRISGGWFTKQTLDDTSSTDRYTIKATDKYTANETTHGVRILVTLNLFTDHSFMSHLILARYNNQVLNRQDGCEEDEW